VPRSAGIPAQCHLLLRSIAQLFETEAFADVAIKIGTLGISLEKFSIGAHRNIQILIYRTIAELQFKYTPVDRVLDRYQRSGVGGYDPVIGDIEVLTTCLEHQICLMFET